MELTPVEDAVEMNELKDILSKAMEDLTPHQKERIKKYYYQQMTYDEIAASENVGKMTAYRSIRAGISKMRKLF
jgi:RNA polymerase sigma factor (sigma-70 family)